MHESVSVGIIGIGYGQNVHLPAFRADDRCRVLGICASTVERAREVADRLQIPRPFGDWRAMVADPEIDALSIAVIPALQVPIVLAAAAARKHVFCEKPVAPSAHQAREMLHALEDARVVHAVDFIFPEVAAWKEARQILQEGKLGPLRSVALSWRVETYANRSRRDSWKLRREEGGGTLNNFVSHSLFCLEWLFGPIVKVAARLSPADAAGDARVDVWLDFDSGLPGTLSVAADAFLGTGHRLEVYGEQGTIVLENRSSDHASGFVLAAGTRDSGVLTPVADEGRTQSGGDGRFAPTAAIVRRFLDSIVSGRPVSPNLNDGLRVQEVIEAIRAADRSGGWQAV